MKFLSIIRSQVSALILILAFSSYLSVSASVPRDGEIWTGVLLATNETTPKALPRWLAPFSERMRKIFGYNQFEVIGRHVEKMTDRDGQWLCPTRQFFLEVQTRKTREGSYELRFTLWQEKRMILETEARVMPGSPLFVRGPQYGRGQLIIVVEVR